MCYRQNVALIIDYVGRHVALHLYSESVQYILIIKKESRE